MSCPCTGEFANVYLTINNLEGNFNAITGNTLSNYNQLSRIIAQQGNIYNAVYYGTGDIFTKNANISGNLLVDGNILFVNTVNNRVGVNTINPITALEVNGFGKIGTATWDITIGTSGNSTSTGIQIYGTDSTGNSVITAFDSNIPTYRDLYMMVNRLGIGLTSPAVQLQLSTDGARKLTTTTWSTGSDYRIKENITDANIDRCYEIVSSIKLKHYRWMDEIANIVDDKSQLGWIAQDVETVFPKAVTTSNSYGLDDFRSLNADQMYKVMYGALTKVIQKCDQYETTIKTHEEIIQSLLTRITTLENA